MLENARAEEAEERNVTLVCVVDELINYVKDFVICHAMPDTSPTTNDRRSIIRLLDISDRIMPLWRRSARIADRN